MNRFGFLAGVASAFLTFVALSAGQGVLAGDPPPTDWKAITQQPFANAKIPDLGLKSVLEKAGQPITTVDAWNARRKELANGWRQVLGPFPQKPASLDTRVISEEDAGDHVRKLVSFSSADSDRILAYLLVPKGIRANEKRPAVVVFHQTTTETLREPVGLGKNPTLAHGLHLVKRGYVVLCPQCYIMKAGGPRKQAEEVGKAWPGLTGMGKMTFDAVRCVDFLETLPYVDAARIGCIGHSLGAKEVLYAMAFEPRYQVGVFNEGGIGVRMSNWTDPWYLTSTFKSKVPMMEHHQLLALCAPRPILILGGDSADGDASWPFVHAALPTYRLFGAEARIGLINHRAKHTYPTHARRQSYEWIDHWLKHHPTLDSVGP